MIQVTVVCSMAPRDVAETKLDLPEGSTVGDAVHQCGLALPEDFDVGVWNLCASRTQRLRPNDRVEIYRPLTVDPKVARRLRFKQQGRGRTGLFARKP
ncbi:MAG: RnfH family protein [Betaproteobacteria bacterium]|nr:RnfH family protein [Betaproteobacteria bacterium]